MGVLALIAVLCFGAAANGPSFAFDCALTGLGEELIFTWLLFPCAVFLLATSRTCAEEHPEPSRAAPQTFPEARPRRARMRCASGLRCAPPRTQLLGALATALIFALCHLAQPWKAPIAFAFSLGMIALYRRTGSIWWPICAHSAFDMLWFGALGLP